MSDLGVKLHTFLIDTVVPHVPVISDEDGERKGEPQVQMITYAVVAPDPVTAMNRFLHEEAGEVVKRGDPIDAILTGIELKQ